MWAGVWAGVWAGEVNEQFFFSVDQRSQNNNKKKLHQLYNKGDYPNENNYYFCYLTHVIFGIIFSVCVLNWIYFRCSQVVSTRDIGVNGCCGCDWRNLSPVTHPAGECLIMKRLRVG